MPVNPETSSQPPKKKPPSVASIAHAVTNTATGVTHAVHATNTATTSTAAATAVASTAAATKTATGGKSSRTRSPKAPRKRVTTPPRQFKYHPEATKVAKTVVQHGIEQGATKREIVKATERVVQSLGWTDRKAPSMSARNPGRALTKAPASLDRQAKRLASSYVNHHQGEQRAVPIPGKPRVVSAIGRVGSTVRSARTNPSPQNTERAIMRGKRAVIYSGSKKVRGPLNTERPIPGTQTPGTRQRPRALTVGVTPARKKAVARRLTRASVGGGDFASLDPEQTGVLTQILKTGEKVGANRKEMLSAVETGLVESGLRNLPSGDADSAGWRQERASIYGTGATGPTNVKAAAKRYFSEAAGFNSPGVPAGELAADTQRPAEEYRGRYEEVKAQAKPLLNAYLKGDVPKALKAKATTVLGEAATKAILSGGKIVKAPKGGGDDGIAVKGLLKHVVNTEGDAAQAQELGVKDGTLSIRGLIPPMQEALVALSKKSGQPVQVNEGFRTASRQIALANGEGGATGPAAAPGTSNHEFGYAADLQLTAEQTALLPEVGLSNTVVGGEPWHVELVSAPTRPDAPPDPNDLGVAPNGVKIKGTNLMVVEPVTPTATTTGTAAAVGGTTTAPTTTAPGTTAPVQPTKGKRRKSTRQQVRRAAPAPALPPTQLSQNDGSYLHITPETYQTDDFIKRLIAARAA